VPQNWLEDCFSENTSLKRLNGHTAMLKPIEWFAQRNKICNKMKASKVQINSIPQNMKEEDIQEFMEDLMKSSDELRAMKLVVLGDGRIGKTTLLNSMKLILDPDSHKVLSLLILDFHVLCMQFNVFFYRRQQALSALLELSVGLSTLPMEIFLFGTLLAKQNTLQLIHFSCPLMYLYLSLSLHTYLLFLSLFSLSPLSSLFL
jgi:hypothetical protein